LGEQTLDELMRDFGGFDHNQQSLRVVTELELKYPEFNGLNLSWEVLEGLRKPFKPDEKLPTFIQPSLEAQVVDVGDQVAYICHDLDDGLDSGLITEAELLELPLWRETSEMALAPYPNLEAERARNYVLRCLLGRLVEDVVTHSDANIEASAPDSADAVRALPRQISFSPQFKPQAKELLSFLYSRLYGHPALREINLRSVDYLQQLFRLLIGHPHLLSPRFEVRIKKNGLHRAICDFLACQTDRQIYILFRRFVGDPTTAATNRLEQAILF
jgi:dGTPase